MSNLKEYRYVGDHPTSLEGGRMIESGAYTGPIDAALLVNKQLLDDGLLLEVPNGTFNEQNPVDDSEPETDNGAQLEPPDEEPASPDNPVIAETNVTPTPVTPADDFEEGELK